MNLLIEETQVLLQPSTKVALPAVFVVVVVQCGPDLVVFVTSNELQEPSDLMDLPNDHLSDRLDIIELRRSRDVNRRTKDLHADVSVPSSKNGRDGVQKDVPCVARESSPLFRASRMVDFIERDQWKDRQNVNGVSEIGTHGHRGDLRFHISVVDD